MLQDQTGPNWQNASMLQDLTLPKLHTALVLQHLTLPKLCIPLTLQVQLPNKSFYAHAHCVLCLAGVPPEVPLLLLTLSLYSSGLGKAFAILWMLFGLIMFGVFSGQVTSFIGEEIAVNGIVNIQAVAGFIVGTLPYTQDLHLAQAFSFDSEPCASMVDCLEKLGSRRISAIVAPRSDVLNYFQVRCMLLESFPVAPCLFPASI